MDYRKMYDDKEHMYAYDLDGLPNRERTLEIASVSRGELTGEQGRKTKKPMVAFVGEPKKLALNKTNGKTIAKLYGTDTEQWTGELVTVFATTTEFGGETVACIRVKPQRPDRSDAQRGETRRQDRGDRAAGGGNGKGRSSQGRDQGKADRAAAEGSAIAAKYLVDQYARIDGSEGLGEDKMAELKAERGRHWEAMSAADRESVGAAAKAAKARIDAAVAGGGSTPRDEGGAVGSSPRGDASGGASLDPPSRPADDDDGDPDADLESNQ